MEIEAKGVVEKEGWKRRAAVIWAGQAFSYLSTAAASFAVMWFITESTASASVLAAAGIASLLPAALLSPLGGVAADRYRRKLVIIVADGIAGFLSLTMAFVFSVGVIELPLVVAILAVRSAATAFHGPALSAMMPQIVPENRLMGVNALDQMLISGAGIAGPVLGALLYSAFGLSATLFLDAGCAVVACLCLFAARIPAHRRTAGSGLVGVWDDMVDGLSCVWRERGVRTLMLVEMLALAFLSPLGSLEPLMVYEVFGGGSWEASFVEAASGIGLLAGSGVAMAMTGIRRKVPIVLGSGVVMGLALTGCGLLPANGYPIFVALFGLVGVGMGMYMAPVMPLVQQRVPEDRFGRVMGIYSSGVLLASPVGLALSGPAAAAVGIAPWFVVCGALMVAVHAVAFARKDLERLDASGSDDG